MSAGRRATGSSSGFPASRPPRLRDERRLARHTSAFQRFSAYIGGFMGASYAVELQDGVLFHTASDDCYSGPVRCAITPSADAWRAFRRALDDLNVWRWHGDYPNEGVLDGTHWSLDIAWADRAIKASGDNRFPCATGQPNAADQPTPTFNRYLRAVGTLLGGRAFE